MSADTTFTSRFRRDNNRGESAASRIRNVYDADGNKIERETSRNSSSVSVNVNRFNKDRDSGKTESIADRMNKLQVSANKKATQDNENNDPPSDKDDRDEEESTSSRKGQKKTAAGAGKKRREKRHLREKRRSTGVVMLGQSVPADEDERKVMDNTNKNQDPGNVEYEATSKLESPSGDEREQLLKKIEEYEQLIEEWKDEMAKLKRENEQLLLHNNRLKDENGALLRVVGSLSGRK